MSTPGWVSTILREESASLLRRWEQRVATPGAGLSPAQRAVREGLPAVLGALGAWLDDDASEPKFPPAQPGESEALRSGHGALLREVIAGYGVLREVLLGALAEHEARAPVSGRESRARELLRLNRGLDLGMTAAVEVYASDEQRSRDVSEAARWRSDFLVRAGERLSQRMDVGTVLQEVAELVVPALADLSTVFLPDTDGRLLRLAVAPAGEMTTGTDPKLAWRHPSFPPEHPIHRAVATGRAQRFDDFIAWAERDSNPAYLAEIRRVGLTSAVIVPLHAHGQTLGVFSAAMTTSGRQFDDAQIELLEALGRKAALILRNSQLYEATEHLRRKAEEASVAKDQFFANISHELRTPLNAILGWSRLLRAEPGPQLERGLATIERNARAQAKLIEDMLDLSRVVSGKLVLRPTLVSPLAAVNVALDSAGPAAHAKGVRLEADVSDDVGQIVADPDRLQQIIWNLVSNAVKFTPAGGLVRVSAHRFETRCELSVHDSGHGITAEFLPHIFERFQQAEHGKGGGMGLGLTIVRHLVELHGGTIVASSEGPGQGARFTVSLPIHAALPHTDDGPAASQRALEGLTVLVVDNEDDARELVATIVEQAGATTLAASSVDEALALYREKRPDAVVTDIGMPGRDGYALARELRALPPPDASGVVLVALTALGRSEDRARAREAGFTDHLAKPIEPSELVRVLARALDRPSVT